MQKTRIALGRNRPGLLYYKAYVRGHAPTAQPRASGVATLLPPRRRHGAFLALREANVEAFLEHRATRVIRARPTDEDEWVGCLCEGVIRKGAKDEGGREGDKGA